LVCAGQTANHPAGVSGNFWFAQLSNRKKIRFILLLQNTSTFPNTLVERIKSVFDIPVTY
jgi:hypothetical protein